MTRHLLDLASVGREAARAIVDEAHRRKAARAGWPHGTADGDAPLTGHLLAAVFEKPSTRTRVSFDVAMRQLGGAAITLSAGDMQLGRGETVADTARVLGGYTDAIVCRTGSHATLETLAAYAGVPVVNGLSDRAHPVQTLTDLMSAEEATGRGCETLSWAWLGDPNNVAYSLVEAAGLFGFPLRLGCPEAYAPAADWLAAGRGHATLAASANEAVTGADVVVTDTWVSMGQAGGAAKLAAMTPYRVDELLMRAANPDAIFLHCLPAHRGEEVTDAVLDGHQSAAWLAATNRVHAQKAALLWVLDRL